MESVTVEIGEVAVCLESADPKFCSLVRARYAPFLQANGNPDARFVVDCLPELSFSEDPDADLCVGRKHSGWVVERGDFHAEWDSQSGVGTVRQARSAYATDSLLRILHSLLLVSRGGFLLHASSMILGDAAYVFSGVSGSGKTTLCRLAPSNATLLTDEVSYIGHVDREYRAFGTPFAGELARNGENTSAPIRAVYLLRHGARNLVTPLTPSATAAALLRNVLFFAADNDLVRTLMQSVCNFVAAVPVRQLEFVPDPSVWEVIE